MPPRVAMLYRSCPPSDRTNHTPLSSNAVLMARVSGVFSRRSLLAQPYTNTMLAGSRCCHLTSLTTVVRFPEAPGPKYEKEHPQARSALPWQQRPQKRFRHLYKKLHICCTRNHFEINKLLIYLH